MDVKLMNTHTHTHSTHLDAMMHTIIYSSKQPTSTRKNIHTYIHQNNQQVHVKTSTNTQRYTQIQIQPSK